MSIKLAFFSLIFALAVGVFGAATNVAVAAPISGAIFTTDSACDGTNVNIFPEKDDVYLDGGPQREGSAGLPDGEYYVQVTEPNGTLLGTSIGTADETPVLVVDGEFAICYQLVAILEDPDGNPGYDTTSNGGGEYKVWISTEPTFTNSNTKTDNFKVDEGVVVTPQGSLTACKYNDANANGVNDAEAPLAGWDFTLSPDAALESPLQTTGATGCVTWTGLDAGSYTVTETNQAGWYNTDPGSPAGTVCLGVICTPSETVSVTTGGTATLEFGNIQAATVRACKYNDLDVSGSPSAGDLRLSGWTMSLLNSADAVLATGVTGTNGCYDFVVLPGTYTVQETAQAGWINTDPGQTGNPEKEVTAVGGQINTVLFGNVQSVDVTFCKYQDLNANGVKDDGEPLVLGWDIKVNGVIMDNPEGCVTVSVLPGSDVTAVEGNAVGWVHTNAASTTVEDVAANTTYNFMNACLGAGGGRTLGFWSNKNGEALMGDNGGIATELALLNGLPLANATGNQADFTTYAQFRTWLLNANATNMAYMLSAQLAAMQLNVEAGLVQGTSLVYAPGVPGASSPGFISITNLMNAAVTALADQQTLSGDPNRATQEAIKTALDNANNNLNFLQTTACVAPTTFTFP